MREYVRNASMPEPDKIEFPETGNSTTARAEVVSLATAAEGANFHTDYGPEESKQNHRYVICGETVRVSGRA